MTNDVSRLHASLDLRTAWAAVRQWPIFSRPAIHPHVIVVSDRNRAAIRAFFASPLRQLANFPSVQPACLNISPTNCNVARYSVEGFSD
jgi:hypothetical protein